MMTVTPTGMLMMMLVIMMMTVMMVNLEPYCRSTDSRFLDPGGPRNFPRLFNPPSIWSRKMLIIVVVIIIKIFWLSETAVPDLNCTVRAIQRVFAILVKTTYHIFGIDGNHCSDRCHTVTRLAMMIITKMLMLLMLMQESGDGLELWRFSHASPISRKVDLNHRDSPNISRYIKVVRLPDHKWWAKTLSRTAAIKVCTGRVDKTADNICDITKCQQRSDRVVQQR